MGQWVKLICGASYQDMPTVQRLVMLYALAGVDCIDVAADSAVVAAARRGLEDAVHLAGYLGDCLLGDRVAFSAANRHTLPWLMVSLNDSEDPHFRKAHFDAAHCPPDCDRPCDPICPTAAIQFQAANNGSVETSLCYGCGRCIAVCPENNIEARSYLASPEAFSREQLAQIDAVEIHTQTGHQAEFEQLWQRLQPWRSTLKLISISCPDHDQVVPYLWDLYNLMAPLDLPLVWQTDGRPMSGDLGKGTTHATIRLAQKILDARLPGYVQPAGGTNGYTIDKLVALDLVNTTRSDSLLSDFSPNSLSSPQEVAVNHHGVVLTRNPVRKTISGIAYGSYGRSQVLPLLDAIDQELQPWLGNGSLVQRTTGHSGSLQAPTLTADADIPPWQRLDSAFGQGLTLVQQLVGQLKVDRPLLSTRYG
ncbi:LdpA C-terminal domain-containing domain [Nodosilinea sp. E11]|nr:LdpA C-terminal domain-containing domain [Nodosilinea sp. E11]WOD38819.1 LdpA C-terminal domain-containing domain [Nodosilinea sp. E11]